MSPIPPNPLLGVVLHGVGAFLSANCYAPQRYIKRWSWEIFWMTQALWCWLLWPIIIAIATIPNLEQVLRESPKVPMLLCALMGGFDNARVVHFVAMSVVVGFFAVHVVMVALVPRSLLTMIRGR